MSKILDDIVDIKGRVGWRGYTVDDLRNEGPWVIGANDITSDHKLTLKNAKHISREKFEESPDIMIRENDILVVKVGSTIGKVAIVDFEIGEACINPNSVLLKNCTENPFYLYYYLKSSFGQNFLLNNSSASAQSALNQTTLKKLPIKFPSLRKQENIVGVIRSIDNKITLNNSINIELEQMTKTLYDYWFVQFDFPNEDGKPYKSSGGKMIYNNILKRKIPEGWEINTLSEINSELIRGISPKYSEDKGIPVINQRCIRNNTVDFSLCRLHNVELKPVKKLIEIGDILVNSTGVGTLGRVAIVKRLENSQTTVDSHVTIVRANTNLVNPLYLGFSLVSKQVEIEKLGEGSTGQTELSRENLGKLQILLPKRDIQNDFASIIKPLFEKIAINEKQNQELTSLRDWLLPMLMNGQVKVVD